MGYFRFGSYIMGRKTNKIIFAQPLLAAIFHYSAALS